MSKIDNGESLHQTKLGWFVWFEDLMNQISMMTKSSIMIFILSFGAIWLAALITTMVGIYHPKLSLHFYFGFLKLALHTVSSNDSLSLFTKSFEAIKEDLTRMFFFHFVFGLATAFFLFNKIRQKTGELADTKFISGTKIISEENRLKYLKKLQDKGEFKFRFRLGRIPLPFLSEVNSVLIMASSGGGKGVLLSLIMLIANRINDIKGLVHDNKPEWTLSCYSPQRGDLIFNPLDARSLKWSIFNDIGDVMDIANFALWIVPNNPQAKDPFWDNSARAILESILLKLWEDNTTTNAAIRAAIRLDGDLLEEFLKGYAGAEFAKKKDSLSALKAKMKWVDFLPDGDFSIKKWVMKTPRGLIFLSNTEKTQAIFAPALTLFVNATGSHVLNLPDDRNRRFFFFLDEFTALGKLDKVIDLLKLGRSKGSSLWLAFQDMQAAEKIYSREDFSTIVNNCKNIAVGQVREPKAAEYFAKTFGKQTFYENATTKSMGVADNRDGLSLQESRKEDYVIKDSDLLNLKEREFFVKINGLEGVTKTMADIQEMPKIAEGFVPVVMSKEEQIAMLKTQRATPKNKVLEQEEELENEETEDGDIIRESGDEVSY